MSKSLYVRFLIRMPKDFLKKISGPTAFFDSQFSHPLELLYIPTNNRITVSNFMKGIDSIYKSHYILYNR